VSEGKIAVLKKEEKINLEWRSNKVFCWRG